MEMRAGGAALLADAANGIALMQTITGLHVDARHVQELAENALTVIEENKSAFVKHIGLGQTYDAVSRCHNRRAFRRCHIDTEMRVAFLAVENALAAEDATDGT